MIWKRFHGISSVKPPCPQCYRIGPAPGQPNDCPRPGDSTLRNMGKCIIWSTRTIIKHIWTYLVDGTVSYDMFYSLPKYHHNLTQVPTMNLRRNVHHQHILISHFCKIRTRVPLGAQICDSESNMLRISNTWWTSQVPSKARYIGKLKHRTTRSYFYVLLLTHANQRLYHNVII